MNEQSSPMNEQEIYTRLQPIFRDIFDDDSLVIGPETHAGDIEDWDSLAHVNLVTAIEKSFKLRFALGELEGLRNVGEMVGLIVQKTAG
jgi:acyl carrier protein